MPKYTVTDETVVNSLGVTLHRIKRVSTGELGGFIESENNLSHDGNAWVFGNAKVYGNAWVFGNAKVYGDARVFGNAQVYGDARVFGNAWVYGNARVCGDVHVYGNAWVFGNAKVSGDVVVSGDARVFGNAWVSGNARVCGDEIKSVKDCNYIQGLQYPITLTPNYVHIGCKFQTYETWLGTTLEQAVGMGLDAEQYPTIMAIVKLFYTLHKGE